jgi:hypothetical protein
LSTVSGTGFFPRLIRVPFHDGLTVVFTAAAIMCVVAAVASLSRGRQRVRQRTDLEPMVAAGAE